MIPHLTLLDPATCERLHAHSLELLSEIPIHFNSRRALDLLAGAGCPVDHDRLSARIPAAVVERCLSAAPRRVLLASRDGRHDLVYEQGTPFRVMLSAQGQRTLDLETGEERPSTAADLQRAVRLADALDAVDMTTEIVNANDRDPATGPNLTRVDLLANSGKHTRMMPETPAEARAVLEMGAAVAGSAEALAERPILSALVCAVSPLSHHGPVIDAGLLLAEAGVPLLIYSMPMAGATGPITVAGLALLSNVEVLSQVVLYQLARPGVPLIYGAGGSFIDLRTALFRGHTQETDLLGLALCDLAHWYGLPVNVNGLSTAARYVGLEAMSNGARSGLVYALAGADELFGIGLVDGVQTLSLEKLYLDAQGVNWLRRLTGGADLECASWPPAGGHAPPGEDEHEWAAAQVRALLRDHEPLPLPAGLEAELRRIAAAFPATGWE